MGNKKKKNKLIKNERWVTKKVQFKIHKNRQFLYKKAKIKKKKCEQVVANQTIATTASQLYFERKTWQVQKRGWIWLNLNMKAVLFRALHVHTTSNVIRANTVDADRKPPFSIKVPLNWGPMTSLNRTGLQCWEDQKKKKKKKWSGNVALKWVKFAAA